MQTIAERLKTTYARIEQATAQANRPLKSVRLLAVSKTKPVSDIRLAYEAGQRLFGENYIQEGVEKIQALQDCDDIEWHMIGPIQSNKTRVVAAHFDWVQSVDRLKIARRLHEQRPDNLAPLNVCIQLNLDDEASKSGVSAEELPALIDQVSRFKRLRLRGLMAIPKASASSEEQQQTLARLAELFGQYHTKLSNFDTLSVGMSGDLEVAIAHGSHMVRVGTAIFGARNS
ncbi:YggS family pyridoxal phosphate-dependent enzyme [Salinimonas marina]|uniref:Pyridoxal phosphate homeostasis protein n=1 Tax=Salinimonas marina TaxID=2785918 RepID=A0A7S9DZK1_9ALTE|nr:YggS family pyridoxal phosphate-dependent enzyme [Salinimonas marina]QPG06265.1 YggS family pyridoxal phosphate-dependent enzyme [Salinimonas marina]